MCLQNEELAKKSILQMARELENSQHPAIRNNVIVVLSDLAVRYSTKVDPYIPNISACLRDDSLLVRKQALTLLAHLLQEDYVKWRGSLFFRFASTLVDEELKRFGEYLGICVVCVSEHFPGFLTNACHTHTPFHNKYTCPYPACTCTHTHTHTHTHTLTHTCTHTQTHTHTPHKHTHRLWFKHVLQLADCVVCYIHMSENTFCSYFMYGLDFDWNKFLIASDLPIYPVCRFKSYHSVTNLTQYYAAFM